MSTQQGTLLDSPVQVITLGSGPEAVPPCAPGARLQVRLVGEADFFTADQLRAELLRVLRERPASLELDLAGLSFCDSQGLEALDSVLAQARAAGVPVTVARTSRQLCRLRSLVADLRPAPVWLP